jgi:type I restriction-modification system DNA methylase subunit
MSTALELLHFTPSEALPGLVPVKGSAMPDRVEEQTILRQAQNIGDIDYVFFRRFSDGRSSHAAACVIDNSDDHLDEPKLAEIHRKLWLNGCTPLLYVGWQTRVDVLSCVRGPDFWKDPNIEYEPAETIEIAAQVSRALQDQIQRFSAYRLSDGTFWDDPDNTALAESGKTAHQQLIRAVVETDREIDGHKSPVLRRLLLLTVLIKYLEDRDVFPPGWFAQFHKGAASFFDLLQQGSPDSIRELLNKLERKFNGDVFELPETEHKLTTKELRRFADLVEARTLKSQRYLWQQFSFQYIPVEVLSHLYQHFAQKGKGAVFTPPILANLMLDFVMPYERLTGQERVFDPTCGSGIFLVGAFRRLVHFWRSRTGWKQPDVATLKAILKRSIFGIELQEEAIHLTAFSLALAVCDALLPNVIWRELRFDKLVGTNLQNGDFSDRLESLRAATKGEPFDVVVGNPPFLSKLTDAAQCYRKEQERKGSIPDNQMAYFIAEQAVSLLKDDGKLCLIQPHGFLYNEKARPFQKAFLSANQLDAVLDLTSIRKLYDGADPKTVALLVTKQKPEDGHRIRHLTFRRTFSIKQRIAFELDHYDRHLVAQEFAEKYPWIWRANLLGGGRLSSLAARLDAMPKLAQVLEDKKWDYGEGFVLAKSGRRESAPWLTDKPFLPTGAFTEDGIDESRIGTVAAKKFRSAYSEERFSAPLVLIKEVDTLPCTMWNKGFLAYRHQIVGIHAPSREEGHLRNFYTRFKSNRSVLRASCAIFGTRALSSKATSILKRDIDALPWPRNGDGWDLSRWETLLCDDVVNFTSEFVRLGQNSRLLSEQVTPDVLTSFSKVFVEMLGSVYENLQIGAAGLLDGLAFQAFYFGDRSEVDWPSDWSRKLREIVYVTHGDALRTVRMLRFYERNTLVMVKPDRLRYWISSTAVRDADETLVDLRRQGY